MFDFSRYDFDAPSERYALVTWARVRDVGVRKDTYGAFHWEIVAMRGVAHLPQLETAGLLYFGRSPWRKSQIVRAVGRLGYLEEVVAKLPPPSPDFEFVIPFDEDDPIFRKSAFVVREETELLRERPSRKRAQRALL